jgi:hypothetical protein
MVAARLAQPAPPRPRASDLHTAVFLPAAVLRQAWSAFWAGFRTGLMTHVADLHGLRHPDRTH